MERRRTVRTRLEPALAPSDADPLGTPDQRIRAHRPRSRPRRIATWVLGSSVVAVALGGTLYCIGNFLTPAPAVRPSDGIIVLGGEFPLRIERAIELYRHGIAPKIWMTGGGYSAPASVELARKMGVPAGVVGALQSNSTWEDAGVAAALASRENLHRLLVVTSWYHGRRALCVMKRRLQGSGVVVYYDAAPSWRYDQRRWWQYPGGWYWVTRETVASVYYWLRYGVAPWGC